MTHEQGPSFGAAFFIGKREETTMAKRTTKTDPSLKEGSVHDNMTQTSDPNHEYAPDSETANVDGYETDATKVAEHKNEDGRTNDVDLVKNQNEPGPGNPEFRHTDPDIYTKGKKLDVPEAVVAGEALSDSGKKLATAETPKVVHQTVTAAGVREITNNTIPDMNERPELVKKAQSLGIAVAPDWSETRLRGEIQIALEGRADLQVKGATPDAKMSSVDYDEATREHKDLKG